MISKTKKFSSRRLLQKWKQHLNSSIKNYLTISIKKPTKTVNSVSNSSTLTLPVLSKIWNSGPSKILLLTLPCSTLITAVMMPKLSSKNCIMQLKRLNNGQKYSLFVLIHRLKEPRSLIVQSISSRRTMKDSRKMNCKRNKKLFHCRAFRSVKTIRTNWTRCSEKSL